MPSLVEPEWLDPYFGGIGQMPPINDDADRLHNRYVNTDIDLARGEITKKLGMDAYLLAINLETYREDPSHPEDARTELVGNIARIVISSDALAGIEQELPAVVPNPSVGVLIADLEQGRFKPLWAQIGVLSLRKAARELGIAQQRVEPIEAYISANRELLTEHLAVMVHPASISDCVVNAMAIARGDVTIDPSRSIQAV